MKKGMKVVMWSGVILLLLIIIMSPKIVQHAKKSKDKQPKAGYQQTAQVRIIVVQPGILQELLKTTGTLLADEEVDLTFESQGKIETICFKEGTHVKKGQVLAKLNDDDLQAQLVKLNLLQNLLQERVNRQKVLLAREAVSQESYDELMTELQSNEAEIKLIRVQIDKTEIRAPFDGIIGLRYISEGAYVNPVTRMARLIKIQPLKIEFAVPERYAGIVKAGNELSFKIENSPENHVARVYALEPAIEPETRTMTLRALYPNKDARLQPGRFVSVQLIIREKKDALKVPTEAIIPELGGEKVFTVVHGKAVSTRVTVGIRTPDVVEITDGLRPGDSVVVSGIMQLRSDMPVTVLTADSIGNQKLRP
ncbi:MAG: efflux RND transporter periplasmic adaptor subunit [Bacteroidales bacterium]|nr:efflux RND transporter periplasmic adaptor subunit [Bacteroidales bacterium]